MPASIFFVLLLFVFIFCIVIESKIILILREGALYMIPTCWFPQHNHFSLAFAIVSEYILSSSIFFMLTLFVFLFCILIESIIIIGILREGAIYIIPTCSFSQQSHFSLASAIVAKYIPHTNTFFMMLLFVFIFCVVAETIII